VAAWIVLILFCVVGPLVVIAFALSEMVKRRRRAKEWSQDPGRPPDQLLKAIDAEAPYPPPLSSHDGVSLFERWHLDSEGSCKQHHPVLRGVRRGRR
jgi:hypothetical protein